MWNFLTAIVIGGVAGWLTGKLMKGDGYGIFMDIIIGIVGGVVGNWIFTNLGIVIFKNHFYVNQLITSLVGAVLIMLVYRLLHGKLAK